MIRQVVNAHPLEWLLLLVEFFEFFYARFTITHRNVTVHARVHARHTRFFASCYTSVAILAIDAVFTSVFCVAVRDRLLRGIAHSRWRRPDNPRRKRDENDGSSVLYSFEESWIHPEVRLNRKGDLVFVTEFTYVFGHYFDFFVSQNTLIRRHT